MPLSMELIGETPVKKKPTSYPQGQDVIKRLGIVTEKEGRVDAATSNSLNTT